MDIKELFYKHCQEDGSKEYCTLRSCPACLADVAVKAGYILPSSEMKLVNISEMYLDRKAAEQFIFQYYWKQLDHDSKKALAEYNKIIPLDGAGLVHSAHIKGRDEGIQAQLLACKKAHAGIVADKEREIERLKKEANQKDNHAVEAVQQAKLEQATLDQTNFDKERTEFWNKIDQAVQQERERILQDLYDLSFRHNPIGKQRINNFIKQALKGK